MVLVQVAALAVQERLWIGRAAVFENIAVELSDYYFDPAMEARKWVFVEGLEFHEGQLAGGNVNLDELHVAECVPDNQAAGDIGAKERRKAFDKRDVELK